MSNTTLVFDGNDLGTLVLFTDLGALASPLTRRGEYPTIANRDGWLDADLPLNGYNFDIPAVIYGDTEAEKFANLTDLATALQGTHGRGTLERRIDNGGATMDGYDSYYARGACVGLNYTTLDLATGELVLSFANLDGQWFSDSGLTTPVPI